jgi:hypothetical protein
MRSGATGPAGNSAVATNRRADQLGVGGGEVALGDQAELGGDAVDPLAAFGFEPPGLFECRSEEQPATGQHRFDA